jgi:hypothetical protein
MPRTAHVTRYVAPFREGGSMPALVEASDEGMYVLKFRGAGQGPKVLVAEWLAGEIGRALGLRVPEIVFLELDPALGKNEPDYEIRSLILASAGTNLGLDYLPGALAFDPAVPPPTDPLYASLVVWLDAFVVNIDRTARNTNLLRWHDDTWLIDNGAAFYFAHGVSDFAGRESSAFPQIKDHVLLRWASRLREADERAHERLDDALFARLVDELPAAFLDGDEAAHAVQRQAFRKHLEDRLAVSRVFVEEAERAHARRV